MELPAQLVLCRSGVFVKRCVFDFVFAFSIVTCAYCHGNYISLVSVETLSFLMLSTIYYDFLFFFFSSFFWGRGRGDRGVGGWGWGGGGLIWLWGQERFVFFFSGLRTCCNGRAFDASKNLLQWTWRRFSSDVQKRKQYKTKHKRQTFTHPVNSAYNRFVPQTVMD